MDVKWVQRRPELSWHGVRQSSNFTSRGGTPAWRTFCGRTIFQATPTDDLPAEKSCESCLRIIARQADQ